MQPGSIIQLRIEKLLYGGYGLAHNGSQACFVSDVAPGELVRACILDVKRHYLTASLSEILESSPHRIVPACPLFYDCGSCQWLHITYDHQLDCKTVLLQDCLKRIGHIDSAPVSEPVASPLIFHYRTRARFKLRHLPNPDLGFFRRKSHVIIPVERCLLLAPQINAALNACRVMLRANPKLFSGFDKADFLLNSSTGHVLVSLTGNRCGSRLRMRLEPGCDCLVPWSDAVTEDIMGISFKRDSLSFYQANYAQNINMIHLVTNYLEPQSGKHILDLFCGSGNFSLFLGRNGAQVTGIDSNHFSIDEACYNARTNGLRNCTFQCADVDRAVGQLAADSFASIVINPPRSGCAPQTIAGVARLQPSSIVYVSCNPSTLARDVHLLNQSGYYIKAAQPFDMFPHTFHIETVVLLVK